MSDVTRQRWLIVGLLISNAILLGVLVVGHFRAPAGPPPEKVVAERKDERRGRFEGRGRSREAMAERLGFGESQRLRLDSLVEDHAAETRQLRSSLRDTRHHLYTYLSDTTPVPTENDTAMQRLLTRIGTQEQQLERSRIAHLHELHRLAETPEQRERLRGMVRDLDRVMRSSGRFRDRNRSGRRERVRDRRGEE